MEKDEIHAGSINSNQKRKCNAYMTTQDICFMTATEMVRRIMARQISVTEVMSAHLARIHETNPALNAIVTLVEDQALKAAAEADRELSSGRAEGPLFGLPVAHKDLTDTRGIRTTSGSPIFKDHIPNQDALIVERLKQAGAITVGKTNAPEFGAGSQTFNQVFGVTRNPYNPEKTCGGSSGGAAVALAAGMVPIADGSDLGGSLRNPAGYCNVVGFRTSTGRVPIWPKKAAWFPPVYYRSHGKNRGRHGPDAQRHCRTGSKIACFLERTGKPVSSPPEP